MCSNEIEAVFCPKTKPVLRPAFFEPNEPKPTLAASEFLFIFFVIILITPEKALGPNTREVPPCNISILSIIENGTGIFKLW